MRTTAICLVAVVVMVAEAVAQEVETAPADAGFCGYTPVVRTPDSINLSPVRVEGAWFASSVSSGSCRAPTLKTYACTTNLVMYFNSTNLLPGFSNKSSLNLKYHWWTLNSRGVYELSIEKTPKSPTLTLAVLAMYSGRYIIIYETYKSKQSNVTLSQMYALTQTTANITDVNSWMDYLYEKTDGVARHTRIHPAKTISACSNPTANDTALQTAVAKFNNLHKVFTVPKRGRRSIRYSGLSYYCPLGNDTYDYLGGLDVADDLYADLRWYKRMLPVYTAVYWYCVRDTPLRKCQAKCALRTQNRASKTYSF